MGKTLSQLMSDLQCMRHERTIWIYVANGLSDCDPNEETGKVLRDSSGVEIRTDVLHRVMGEVNDKINSIEKSINELENMEVESGDEGKGSEKEGAGDKGRKTGGAGKKDGGNGRKTRASLRPRTRSGGE